MPRLRTIQSNRNTRGITSNLTRYAYLAFLLEVNEYIPKEHKLTDFQIVRCVVNEFPKWERAKRLLATLAGTPITDPRDSLSYYRRRYNKGLLIFSHPGRKGPISFKYNSNGDRISSFSPKLLPEREYNRILKTYGPDNRRTMDFDFVVKPVKQPDKVKKPFGPPTYKSFDWCI